MKDQDMKNQEGKSQQNQDNTGKGVGISGQNPGKQEGPSAGNTSNTGTENTSGQKNTSGQNQENATSQSPQGSAAKPSDTRGADSSDKEIMNNQPNASTLQNQQGNKDTEQENK
jgi:hypothetical protein